MANYAFKKGAKKVAIVQEVSNDYSVGLAKFFKEAFEKLAGPGSVVDIANYQTGDKDFTAQLTNLKAKNPDADPGLCQRRRQRCGRRSFLQRI